MFKALCEKRDYRIRILWWGLVWCQLCGSWVSSFFGGTQILLHGRHILPQDLDSYLIEIHSQDQLDFIKMELQLLDEEVSGDRIYWWSSGSDSGRKGQWYWQHSLTSVDDFVWAAEFPSNISSCNYLCFMNDLDYMIINCQITIPAKSICQK